MLKASRLLTRNAISPRPHTDVRLSFLVDDGMVSLPHLANIVQWSLGGLHGRAGLGAALLNLRIVEPITQRDFIPREPIR